MLVDVANAMIAAASESIEHVFGEGAVDVQHGPGEWDGEYLKELYRTLPAVRVALMGAVVDNQTSVQLNPATFAISVATGWGDCNTPESLQLGTDGTHALLDALLVGMHNRPLVNPDGVRIGFCKMQTLDNLWQGAFSQLRISVFQMTAAVNMPVHIDSPDTLQDFLRTGVEWDIDGGDIDMTDTINMRGAA